MRLRWFLLELVFVAALLAGGHVMASYALGQEPWVWQPEPGEMELFVGGIKMGKSHAAAVRTRKVRRLLAWDPQDDEAGGSGRVTIGQLEQLYARRPELLVRGALHLAVRPTAWNERELHDQFNRFARIAWGVGGLCVKVDETGRLVRGGYYPDGLGKMLAEGRHRWLSVVLVGQRFPMVPVLARDNATRLIVFRHGYDDAPEVAARVSFGGPRIAEEQVAGLRRFDFIEWTPTEGARLRPPLGTSLERSMS